MCVRISDLQSRFKEVLADCAFQAEQGAASALALSCLQHKVVALTQYCLCNRVLLCPASALAQSCLQRKTEQHLLSEGSWIHIFVPPLFRALRSRWLLTMSPLDGPIRLC